MPPQSTVLLLVGPKGSGKTFLGKLLEAELGVPFVPVEAIFLDNLRTSRLAGSARDAEGYAKVLAQLDAVLRAAPCASLETTATSEHFPAFLEALRARGAVRLVAVRAPPELCLERVASRGAAGHLPASLERVAEINAVASGAELPWDLEVDNGRTASAGAILARLREIGVGGDGPRGGGER